MAVRVEHHADVVLRLVLGVRDRRVRDRLQQRKNFDHCRAPYVSFVNRRSPRVIPSTPSVPEARASTDFTDRSIGYHDGKWSAVHPVGAAITSCWLPVAAVTDPWQPTTV